jgi:diguanylate cyclase (GGDEF)-like protein/PAS domain S-box-containing protein
MNAMNSGAPLPAVTNRGLQIEPPTLGKQRLLRLVWPFVLVILVQALLASLSFHVLSAVRAYVGGESMWSKGQKDAIHFITLYAESGEEQYFHQFQRAVAAPLADRAARYALEQRPPDLNAARDGFLGGGNHPDDVPGLIWLFRYFGDVPYMATAIGHWRATDPFLDQLVALANAIHEEFQSAPDATRRAAAYKAEIDHINERLAPAAIAFTQSLGAGSRSIKVVLTAANGLSAILLIFLIVFHTRKMLRQRLAFETALKAEKERAEVTLASLGEAVISTDAEGRLNYMNAAAERLIGLRTVQAEGSSLDALFSLVDEATGATNDHLIHQSLGDGVVIDRQRLVRPDSSSVAVSVVGAPLHSDGEVTGAVLVLHDMTREREFVARLSWQASHDELTGLANRREFETRLKRTLEDLTHLRGEHSLMFLDLDQFKIVNDTCGHAAGDQLLKQTSSLLQRNVGTSALLARLGGDEFGVLLRDCDADSAIQIAERLRLAVRKLSFVWNGRTFNISVSIGLVHVTETDTVEETLKAADMACYMAKEKGRDRIQVYRPSDSELMARVGEMGWVQRIRNGLDERRFCLFCQEIRALHDARSDGAHVELLLRLHDEDGNLVGPGGFLPAAERYGLMPLIDRWVVRNAFALLADRAKSPGLSRLSSCAINVSGASLGDDGFVDYVCQQFEMHGVPPHLICFEITETSAVANIASARCFIQTLQRLGCRFALDDFGTGMSSFAYLKHLPVDYIKIDGSFVKEIPSSNVDLAMVETIARMAKVMGKGVIAECVESGNVLEILREIGVDYAQGFAIGQPKPFESAYPQAAAARWEVA